MTRPVRAQAPQEAPLATGRTVEFQVCLRNGRQGSRRLRTGADTAPLPVEVGNVPRISRLMALAIRLDGLIREGAVRDYAELARVGHVTRARVTQIMNLLNLAPDIQEALLFLPRTVSGRDRVTERQARLIVAHANWEKQKKIWDNLQQQRLSAYY